MRFFLLVFGSAALVCAQNNLCLSSANPPVVRVEGLAERVGDIVYTCIGIPNSTLTGNFAVGLNVNITNRISAGNTLTGIVFTIDNGSGPQPILVQPLLTTVNTLVYNGVTLTYSPQGTFTIRFAGIRGNATQMLVGERIFASLALNGTQLLAFSPSALVVGTPQRTLYDAFSDALVCAQNGSPVPDEITFTNLIARKTAFATTRVTEGFADAFGPRTDFEYFNADSGQRIIARYSGFPAEATLYVPDVIAGSSAIEPTSGGDFGLPASGGKYAPSDAGSLLLARVAGANANGAGGTPVYLPGAIGSGTVAFDTVSALTITGGSAYVVYEVVDANPHRQESAQFPTFLGLAPNGNANAVQTTEEVFLAPLSTVGIASASEPLPRFIAVAPQPDCSIIGDCARILPKLTVDTTPITFSEPASSISQEKYFTVRNDAGGRMHWTASITYTNGSGWLRVDPTQGINNTTIRVDTIPNGLAPGTYQATITVDAGAAGSSNVPVTLILTAAATPSPTISMVINAASFDAIPVVPGSLTTIMGSAFSGKSLAANFDGLPATILFNNDTQINLLVPDALGTKDSARLTVAVDGVRSTSQTVTLAPFAPAIFKGAVLNQDSTVNSANNGASRGSVIYLFATGLSGVGTITAHIHDRDIAVPYYAGPAPGLLGVQQVNLVVPDDLPAMTTELYVCGTSATKVCSVPAPLTLK